jgi:hypothetical protein
MPQVRGTQMLDGSIKRVDLDAATPGEAVIRRALPGDGVCLISTGPDVGTGDVTIATDGTPYVSGNYYGLSRSGQAHSAGSASANQLRAFPWWIPRACSFNQVVSEVTTLLAGSLYRLGLYSNTASDFYPGSLLANSDAAEYSGAAVGVKTGTPAGNIVIPEAGWYWLVHNGNAAVTMRRCTLAGIDCPLGNNIVTGLTIQTCYQIAQTYGVMPATFPAGAAKTALALPPVSLFRVV